MGKRVVVQDLEYWAREAGAVKERRRISRAIAPALKALGGIAADLRALGYRTDEGKLSSAAMTIDRATRAPRKAPGGPPVDVNPSCRGCKGAECPCACHRPPIDRATRAPKRRSRNAR